MIGFRDRRSADPRIHYVGIAVAVVLGTLSVLTGTWWTAVAMAALLVVQILQLRQLRRGGS